jgi:hypothetical protein
LSLQIGESKISLETKSENIKERCTRTKYKGSIAKQKNAQIFLSIRQMIQQVFWQNIEHKWVKGEKEICPSVHTFGTMLCRK